MKLQEKQMWAKVETEVQNTQTIVKDTVGSEIQISIDQGSFSGPELIERIPNAALAFMVKGFEDFCADAMAKQAAQESIKSVRIKQEERENFQMTLQGNTLEVIANFSENGTCGVQYPHQNDYVKFLGSNL